MDTDIVKRLYYSYGELYIQHQNVNYLANILATNWQKRTKTTLNKQQQENMQETVQSFKNLAESAKEKEETVKKTLEEMQEHFNLEPIQVILHLVFIVTSYITSLN